MEARLCPICDGPLEQRAVGPCLICGGDPEEVEHHLTGLHGYAEYEVFGGMRIVLCNFCALDFARLDPRLFGLPADPPLERSDLHLRARLERPEFEQDGYCPRCERRQAFLRFQAAARAQNAASRES